MRKNRLVENFDILLRMYLWWSLCTSCFHAYQVRVTVLLTTTKKEREREKKKKKKKREREKKKKRGLFKISTSS